MTARLAVNLYFFANGLIYATWASRIPDLQQIYDMDNSQMGFILLAHSIGAFVAMPFTGWLTHRYGSKWVAFVSGIAFCICFACSSLAIDYWTLFIPFLLMGSTTGIMDVSMNAQAVEVERNYHKPIMTFFHAIFSIGMVTGGIIGSYFISQALEVSMHFYCIAAIASLLILLGRGAMIKDSHQDSDEESNTKMWPSGVLLSLGIIALCCMIGEGAMSDWSTNYMKNIVQSPISYTTFGLTAFAGAMTVGRLFGDQGRLKYGDFRILSGGAICALLGMVAILSSFHYLIVIIGFGLVGLGLSNIVPIAFSLSGNLKDVPSGVGIAMVSTIGYTGFMMGPPIIGFIADIYDLRIALSILAVLFITMFLLILMSRSINSAKA